LAIHRQILCTTCGGHGGPKEKRFTCKKCKGRGQVVELRQLGPSMMQQVQAVCDECHGQGQGFTDKDKCTACGAKGTTPLREVIEVHIPAGTEHQKQFTFFEKGHEAAEVAPGDLIVVVQQETHAIFQRRGANLFMKKTLSLFQALTGFEFQLIHLDGHKLTIKSKSGTVLSPGAVQVVRGQGMPLGIGTQTGDLYLEYDVVFPKTLSLSPADTQTLRKALGANEEKRELINGRTVLTPSEDTAMDDEEVTLEDVDLNQESQKWKEQHEQQKMKHGATEEDDEERGPRVQQCPTQ